MKLTISVASTEDAYTLDVQPTSTISDVLGDLKMLFDFDRNSSSLQHDGIRLDESATVSESHLEDNDLLVLDDDLPGIDLQNLSVIVYKGGTVCPRSRSRRRSHDLQNRQRW
ncbi:hypothetical protein GEMRC1_004559 [Eukaryota sp. GEM-RC1]